jgi:DNA mismatch repair protein MutL
MSIKKLDEKTTRLISAGEVIECPADVLKELIENSIDANSTTITVNIKSSGIDLIEVVDDGDGISKSDLSLCLDKYTTSKIKSIDDLYSLNSFGFRGEALFSINSVAVVEITSAVNDNGKGFYLDKNKKIIETSFKKGTKITIKDLFYNLPVRKKFLKSKTFEFSKIYDVFLEFVVANPNITFYFNSDKKNVVFNKTDFKNRFFQIFGKSLFNQTIDVDITSDFYSVSGIVLKPRSDFTYSKSFTYINNRCVNFFQINFLLKSIYKDYLMIQQKPFFILFFKINPNTIDVNVHPKKRIVKLQNEQLFLMDIKQKLSSLLFSDKESITSFKKPNNYFETSYNFKTSPNKFTSNNFSNNQQTSVFSEKITTHQNYFSENENEPIYFNGVEIIKIISQIHNTYILCETKEGVFIIDQHAAAERINLEKNQMVQDRMLEKQKLISFKELSFLNDHQINFLKNNKSLFVDLGFDYIFKDSSVYLTTIPFFLKTYFDSNVFLSLLNDLQTHLTEDFETVKTNIVKKYSCSESIKANQQLSIPEIKKLIKQLDSCDHKMICAHGRPTVIFMSITDFEKLFKRVV